MGVGKTSVGLRLAKTLDVPFVDLDEMIERMVGEPIAALFARWGEAHFRNQESKALRRVFDGPPGVVSLGGGTLHHGDNQAYVQSQADLVCLSLPFEAIQQRVGDTDTERPLWVQARQLYDERLPLYQSAGTYIDISGMSVDDVVGRMVEECQCG